MKRTRSLPETSSPTESTYAMSTGLDDESADRLIDSFFEQQPKTNHPQFNTSSTMIQPVNSHSSSTFISVPSDILSSLIQNPSYVTPTVTPIGTTPNFTAAPSVHQQPFLLSSPLLQQVYAMNNHTAVMSTPQQQTIPPTPLVDERIENILPQLLGQPSPGSTTSSCAMKTCQPLQTDVGVQCAIQEPAPAWTDALIQLAKSMKDQMEASTRAIHSMEKTLLSVRDTMDNTNRLIRKLHDQPQKEEKKRKSNDKENSSPVNNKLPSVVGRSYQDHKKRRH